jgi:transposase
MGLSRRTYTKEFKLAAVQRLEQGVSLGEVARALEVNPNVLHRWRREFRQGPGNAFPGNGKQRWSEGRIAELERKIGQQALEIDFLKGCLQRIEEQRMLQALTGNPRSTGKLSGWWNWAGFPGPVSIGLKMPSRSRIATWISAMRFSGLP